MRSIGNVPKSKMIYIKNDVHDFLDQYQTLQRSLRVLHKQMGANPYRPFHLLNYNRGTICTNYNIVTPYINFNKLNKINTAVSVNVGLSFEPKNFDGKNF